MRDESRLPTISYQMSILTGLAGGRERKRRKERVLGPRMVCFYGRYHPLPPGPLAVRPQHVAGQPHLRCRSGPGPLISSKWTMRYAIIPPHPPETTWSI